MWAAAVHIIIHTNFEGGEFPPPLALCRKNLLQVAGSSLVMSLVMSITDFACIMDTIIV